MAFTQFINMARSAGALAHELWQWLGTLQPVALVAFGSFAPHAPRTGPGRR